MKNNIDKNTRRNKPETPRSLGKKLLFTGIFLVGSFSIALCLGLVVLEVVLRVTTNPFVTPGYTRTHPERRYELRPNFRGRTYEAGLRINSDGLRDNERPISTNDQAYRIAVFGDSMTFGIGVESEETFVKVMERQLNDVYARDIQVFNFGVPSYNTVNEYRYLRDSYDQFKPHAVIFQFTTGNDTVLSDPPGSPTGLNQIRALRMLKDALRHLYSYDFLASRYYRLRYNLRYRDLQRRATRSPANVDTADTQAPTTTEVTARVAHDNVRYADAYQGWIDAQHVFGEIAEFGRARQIPVIVAVFANNVRLARTLEADPFYAIITKVNTALHDQGIEHVLLLDDAFRDYVGRETLLWVKPDDAHFSVLAHRLAAEVLCRYVQAQQLIEPSE